jgi:hypothetical protein
MLDTNSLRESARKLLSDTEFISSKLIEKKLLLAANEIEALREMIAMMSGCIYDFPATCKQCITLRNTLLTKNPH